MTPATSKDPAARSRPAPVSAAWFRAALSSWSGATIVTAALAALVGTAPVSGASLRATFAAAAAFTSGCLCLFVLADFLDRVATKSHRYRASPPGLTWRVSWSCAAVAAVFIWASNAAGLPEWFVFFVPLCCLVVGWAGRRILGSERFRGRLGAAGGLFRVATAGLVVGSLWWIMLVGAGVFSGVRLGTLSLHFLLFLLSTAAGALAVLAWSALDVADRSRSRVSGAPGRWVAAGLGVALLWGDRVALRGSYAHVHVLMAQLGSLFFASAAVGFRAPGKGAFRLRKWDALGLLVIGGCSLAWLTWTLGRVENREAFAASSFGDQLLRLVPPEESIFSAVDEVGLSSPPDMASVRALQSSHPVPPRAVRHVLLITIDGLRADFVPSKFAPHLSRFASQAVVFERAYSHSSKTQQALAALLTARLPAVSHPALSKLREGKVGSASEQTQSHVTLAQRLRERGYTTLATVDSEDVSFLQAEDLFAPGFDSFLSLPGDSAAADSLARRTAEEAIVQREGLQGPWFQWVHFFDPHRTLDAQEYRTLVERADGGVALLLDDLRDRDLLRRTVVVITADHGRSLGEHQRFGHATALFEEQVRVPLSLHVPGLEARVHPGAVGLVDVAQTLLALAGAPSERRDDGLNLIPLLQGQPSPREVLFAELLLEGPPGRPALLQLNAAIGERYKVIADRTRGQLSVFDLESDPKELHALRGPMPPPARRLAAQLLGFIRNAESRPDEPR